jgi:NADPH:quinone reductase-like Zn-dependent oxidoreductase
MKAVVYEKYGPPGVLHLKEVEKPVPKNDEVLIRIHATTVTSGDWRARSLKVPVGFGLVSRLFFGVTKPRQPILGTEAAGVIESVGGNVRKVSPGDHVFAFSGVGMGCYAEYKCMKEEGVVPKPSNLTFEEAAALSFGGTTMLDFFRRGKLKRGERVLINGASGGVGTAAVQLARHLGAQVTGVCSASNLDLVKSLGATHAIDYTKEDFTVNRSRNSLKKGGRLLLVLAGLTDILSIPWVSLTTSKRIIAGPASEKPDDLRFLAELAQAGEYMPVIDRRYTLEQIVEAHRYLDTGRKRGNIVVTLIQ